MTDHPITPPPELAAKWVAEIYNHPAVPLHSITLQLVERAAQWGSNQELEACCLWLRSKNILEPAIDALRTDRRPKPPSLKEQALEQLDGIAAVFRMTHGGNLVCDTIRRAIEALPE
jgi:hypothetical protein